MKGSLLTFGLNHKCTRPTLIFKPPSSPTHNAWRPPGLVDTSDVIVEFLERVWLTKYGRRGGALWALLR
ncbi:hypothetical protein E2C01_075967 [Portunus trituberculatus]|uniref:Uncharacterized protein n=1 Tax=Portunus trituberculatus TaxID=210409 RepID=A0A5B7IGL8_PORTR|nr:hypothetical protein [Portunus trituberculatus]